MVRFLLLKFINNRESYVFKRYCSCLEACTYDGRFKNWPVRSKRGGRSAGPTELAIRAHYLGLFGKNSFLEGAAHFSENGTLNYIPTNPLPHSWKLFAIAWETQTFRPSRTRSNSTFGIFPSQQIHPSGGNRISTSLPPKKKNTKIIKYIPRQRLKDNVQHSVASFDLRFRVSKSNRRSDPIIEFLRGRLKADYETRCTSCR